MDCGCLVKLIASVVYKYYISQIKRKNEYMYNKSLNNIGVIQKDELF